MKKDSFDVSKYPKVYQEVLAKELAFASKFVSGSDSVLDIGCGNGRIVEKVAPSVGKYIGVDIDRGYISEAMEKFKSIKNAKFMVVDCVDLDKVFEKGEFQKAVALWNTMACVKDDKKCLQQIASVISEGLFFTVNMKGTLAIREKYYKDMGIIYSVDRKSESISSELWNQTRAYSMSEIKDLIKASGLKLQKIDKIRNVLYAVYLNKRA